MTFRLAIEYLITARRSATELKDQGQNKFCLFVSFYLVFGFSAPTPLRHLR